MPVRIIENVDLTIELEREDDGRWIAEAVELPGVMCYGETRERAICETERLAIEVIAERISHGELPSSSLTVSFVMSDESWPATHDGQEVGSGMLARIAKRTGLRFLGWVSGAV